MTEIEPSADLFRLSYMSRNSIVGGQEQVEREIAQILLASRRNNPGKGVTGALIYSADCFLQTLEGSMAAVQLVFELIERDPRHCEILVLESCSVEHRRFPEWSMAYSGSDERVRARIEALIRLGAEAPFSCVADELLEQLRSELDTVSA